WLTLRIAVCPFVQHAPIVGPGKSPIGTCIVVWVTLARARPVAIALRKNAAVDPTTARRAAIHFQILEVADLPAIFDSIAVDLFQNSFDVGFIVNSAR